MLRLSDEQWERIRDHFPEENIPEGCPGRKPVPAREVLEAVLWISQVQLGGDVAPLSAAIRRPDHQDIARARKRRISGRNCRDIMASRLSAPPMA